MEYLTFALIGLGVGSLYAAIGLGVIVTFRGTGIVNFATGAIAMWPAYVYVELRETGDLVLPVVGLPHRVDLGHAVAGPVAFAAAVTSAAVIGLLAHVLVFRPLRRAPGLAKLVASVGVLLFFQSLTALQFGTASRTVDPIVPDATVSVGGLRFPQDRLWLTAVVVVAASLLALYFRHTRIGLATLAAAENQRAISLARFSPQLLAGAAWMLSGVVVGTIGILVAPTTVLNPASYTLAIVPALAAALLGRLDSIMVTVAVALGLGAFQSIVTYQTSRPWWPDWAVTGLSDAVPFAVIVVALFLLGGRLPTRGEATSERLPEVAWSRLRPWGVATLAVAGLGAILLTGGSYRFGVITSMITSIVMLSLVVLTGLIGQISLAQAALAGVSGFALSKLTTGLGVPFPVSLVAAALAAMAVGVVIGVPALRIRGTQLAVVTLACGVAVERFVLRNPKLTASSGSPIAAPTFAGLDLSIRAGRTVARWQFGMVALVVLVLAVLAVGNVGASATGRRLLAVRSQERAAAASGISVETTKLVAFGLASFLAGLGGALIGYSRGQLSPDSFTALVGLTLLAFAYLGGITSISGALIAGALAPLGVVYVVLDRLVDLGTGYGVFAGASLVATALFNQEGIAGAARRVLADRARHRGQVANTGHDAAVIALPPPGEGRPAAPLSAPSHRKRPRDRDGTVLVASDISVRFGGVVANQAIDLAVGEGRVVGLIGPNGAGKTTFIDAVTGFVPSSGRLLFDGIDISGLRPHQRARAGLVRTWQSVELFSDLTVRENLLVVDEPATAAAIALDLVRPGRRHDHHRVERALDTMGLGHLADRRPGQLSVGEQKLVGVARAIATGPRLIMMDEPAAGLDTTESALLGARLRQIVDLGISVLLVDHDMGLVLEVCDDIVVLDFGRVIASGPPAAICSDPSVITAYLGEQVPA